MSVGNDYNGKINLLVPTRLKKRKYARPQKINAIHFPYSIIIF